MLIGGAILLRNLIISLSMLTSTAPPDTLAPFDPVIGFAPKMVSFDDRAGEGFEWNKRLPCGVNRATVTVKFERAYSGGSTRQAPVAKIWLHSGKKGEASEQWIAATLKAPTDTWKLNGSAWLEKVTSTESESPGGYAPAELNHPVQIDFAWTPGGAVSVNFGGEFVKRVTMDKPITDIGVGGSWAKFQFLDLKVGRAGPPDPACNTRANANSQGIWIPPISTSTLSKPPR